jgi:hypothetical protein
LPARPFDKGILSEDKAFESGEDKLESGARREGEMGLTVFVRNFEFCW